jgi:hypothetical protein
MASRPYLKGCLTLPLVPCAVALYPADSRGKRVSFRWNAGSDRRDADKQRRRMALKAARANSTRQAAQSRLASKQTGPAAGEEGGPAKSGARSSRKAAGRS